jgi:4-hydroxy-tetrahydrodipicolinate reductase
MIDLAIHGAAGRMGSRLVALAAEDPELNLVAALEHSENKRLGEDSGSVAGVAANGIALTTDLDIQPQALIDFSLPAAVDGIVALSVERTIPLVVATTGFGDPTIEKIRQAAESIPIVWAPNMSLAVNLTMKLVEIAAQVLNRTKASVDVEILERHHRFKADAPSGTALKFGEIVKSQMGNLEEMHGRQGQVGQRGPNEIGYHAIRAGDDPGQHTILFGMLGEKIELQVAASNRDCYALGALAAAKFVAGSKPGLYSMMDVLGI